jgi:hypothetical protein
MFRKRLILIGGFPGKPILIGGENPLDPRSSRDCTAMGGC